MRPVRDRFGDDRLGFRDGRGDRLFDEHVAPGGKRLDRHGRVGVRIGADRHAVRLRRGQRVIVVVELGDAAEFRRQLAAAGARTVDQAHEVEPGVGVVGPRV